MLISLLVFLGQVVLLILGVVLLYIISIFILSWIPKHRHFQNNSTGIEIYIISNGVHSDFVLPKKSMAELWWDIINLDDFEFKNGELQYLGFGWGDRGFYLDTPSWAELKFKTAANAMLIPSPTLMHIKAFDSVPTEQKYMEKLVLTPFQFSKLCRYIFNSFHQDANQQITLLPNKGYTSNDNFYLAKGSYHAFNTCNYWVNKGLRKIGVRTSLWTPIDRGIFYQLKRMSAKQVAA